MSFFSVKCSKVSIESSQEQIQWKINFVSVQIKSLLEVGYQFNGWSQIRSECVVSWKIRLKVTLPSIRFSFDQEKSNFRFIQKERGKMSTINTIPTVGFVLQAMNNRI